MIYNMVDIFLSDPMFSISSIPQFLFLFSLSLVLHNHVCSVCFSAPSPCPVCLTSTHSSSCHPLGSQWVKYLSFQVNMFCVQVPTPSMPWGHSNISSEVTWCANTSSVSCACFFCFCFFHSLCCAQARSCPTATQLHHDTWQLSHCGNATVT